MAVLTVTEENYAREVLQSDNTVLLDFWADWCGPCRMVAPILEQIAGENPDVKVCKINVEEQPKLAALYEIMSIPTLVVIKNGEVTNRTIGALPKGKILAMLG